MKLKLFVNLVFTFVGTVILLACTSVVAFNFVRDSRAFANPIPVVAETEDPDSSADENIDNDVDKTLEYNRSIDPVPSKKPKITPSPDQKPSDSPEPSPTLPEDLITVRVEVINYSGLKKLAESVRETLELYGYKVSAGNGKTNTPIVSQIIERNDEGAGTDLKNILKIGNVIKIPDPKSRFDATVIIGDDYDP